MKPGSNGNIGAQRGHSRTPSSSLYGHPESQGSHEPSARITRSMSRLARSDGLIIPGPFTELTLPLLPPANNPQANGTIRIPPSWNRIQQVQFVPSRTQGDGIPANFVVFSVNGAPGISISRVVAGDYAGLDGKDDNVSSIAVNRVICRIQFADHGRYRSNVNTRNANWTSIKRCKLAKEVGRKVKQYIEREGLQGTYSLEKVHLTRLTRVSKGSWQPELYHDPSTPNLDV